MRLDEREMVRHERIVVTESQGWPQFDLLQKCQNEKCHLFLTVVLTNFLYE